jgi:hypothetical protein
MGLGDIVSDNNGDDETGLVILELLLCPLFPEKKFDEE